MVTLICTLFPHQLILFYVGKDHGFTPDLLHLATIVLILTGSRLVLDTIIEVKVGSLRGMLDVKFPMVLSIVITWGLGVPLAYVLCFSLKQGLIGITVSGIIVMGISAVALYFRWLSKTRSLPVLLN